MADTPLHLMAARLRPPAPAASDDDEDWDAVIARAKMQAALPGAPRLPPPPSPRDEWAAMSPTPPPSPRAPRLRTPEATRATLDALGLKRPPAPPPARAARRPADWLPTPLPLGKALRAAGFRSGPVKR